jgi:hypothetical protein
MIRATRRQNDTSSTAARFGKGIFYTNVSFLSTRFGCSANTDDGNATGVGPAFLQFSRRESLVVLANLDAIVRCGL